jgi:DNA transposition AAA+ family ATPase
MRKTHISMTEQLRRLIDKSGMTKYQVAKKAKIDHATMSRFMAGKCGLSYKALNRLGKALNLEIVVRQK